MPSSIVRGIARIALTFGLFVASAAAFQAHGADDDFLDIDMDGDGRADAKGSDPSAWTWPRSARFAPTTNEVALRWPGKAVDEILSFDDVIRLERTRPYESHPDELFVLLADGRRVLLSRGADVGTHAVLLSAATGLPATELPPGEGHFMAVNSDQLPPQVRIGPGDGVRFVAARTADIAMRNRRGAGEMVKLVDDDHPSLKNEGGGVLDKHDIELVLKQQMSLFMRCYQKELQRNPGLKGTVVVRFVIDRDGSVRHSHARASSLGNNIVEECLVDEIDRTKFPRPAGGTVIISYPFNFQPL